MLFCIRTMNFRKNEERIVMQKIKLFIMVAICLIVLDGCGNSKYIGQYGGLSDEGIFVSLTLNEDSSAETNIMGMPVTGTYVIDDDIIEITMSVWGYSDTIRGRWTKDGIDFGDVTLKRGVTSVDISELAQNDSQGDPSSEETKSNENTKETMKENTEEKTEENAEEKIDLQGDEEQETADADEIELEVIDPFEGLELQYDGISPFITVSFNTGKVNKIAGKYVNFAQDREENLYAIGDQVIVTADYSEFELKEEGYCIEKSEEKYVVPKTDKYLESADEADLSRLEQEMADYMEAKCAASVGESLTFFPIDTGGDLFAPDLISINKIEPVTKYCAVIKPQYDNTYEIHNKYAMLFKVNFTFSHVNTGNYKPEDQDSYMLIFADNVIVKENGEITWAGEDNSTGERLYGEGQAKAYDQLVSRYITGIKDKYNVEEIELID